MDWTDMDIERMKWGDEIGPNELKAGYRRIIADWDGTSGQAGDGVYFSAIGERIMRLDRGKYRDRPISEVPYDYAVWFYTNVENAVDEDIRKALATRIGVEWTPLPNKFDQALTDFLCSGVPATIDF
jgi:hypothetical protein